MDMLVVGLCFTFFAVAVTALVFVAATRPQASTLDAPSEQAVTKAAPARFFAEHVSATIPAPMPPIPIEVLLQQLENHVRLEQAAAASFVSYPSHAQLHSKTTSPFVN